MTLASTRNPNPSLGKSNIFRRGALLAIAGLLTCSVVRALGANAWQPKTQAELHTDTAYAYHQWQSTGFYLKPGDQFTLKASGQWRYSPEVDWHGPEGGNLAPDYYPLANAPGGALIGRIGEMGAPFYLGRQTTSVADTAGLLYVQINDDLLGDNVGQLQLEIAVKPAQ